MEAEMDANIDAVVDAAMDAKKVEAEFDAKVDARLDAKIDPNAKKKRWLMRCRNGGRRKRTGADMDAEEWRYEARGKAIVVVDVEMKECRIPAIQADEGVKTLG